MKYTGLQKNTIPNNVNSEKKFFLTYTIPVYTPLFLHTKKMRPCHLVKVLWNMDWIARKKNQMALGGQGG